MDAVTIEVATLEEWKRRIKAIHGQAQENMRPGQGRTDVMFTLENLYNSISGRIDEAASRAEAIATGSKRPFIDDFMKGL